jgi:hypothetical protein
MKELIRQIRSLGSQRMLLVCMLPMWQKPEGSFMAPTYNTIGGSDFSYTRQGGISLITFLMQLASMVPVLLEEKINSLREKIACRSVFAALIIDYYQDLINNFRIFSYPKATPRP